MGKAGSGKSTLMKFLVNHPLIEQHLESWAAGKTIVVAKYFFWNAGNDLQKSQEGLLRSLLFAILRRCPSMISSLSSELPSDLEDAGLDIWNVKSLLKLFDSLSQQAEPTTKFCFFIDGLDEYEGDSMDLIKALRALSKLKMVKLCVSSRPWHVFKDEYVRPNYRMLKLEDLTRDDIALYVRDVLEEHERFDALQQRDHRYQELVRQIVKKAEGVFLWVSLVVQSLLRGLTSSDRMSDLQRRIELLLRRSRTFSDTCLIQSRRFTGRTRSRPSSMSFTLHHLARSLSSYSHTLMRKIRSLPSMQSHHSYLKMSWSQGRTICDEGWMVVPEVCSKRRAAAPI